MNLFLLLGLLTASPLLALEVSEIENMISYEPLAQGDGQRVTFTNNTTLMAFLQSDILNQVNRINIAQVFLDSLSSPTKYGVRAQGLHNINFRPTNLTDFLRIYISFGDEKFFCDFWRSKSALFLYYKKRCGQGW